MNLAQQFATGRSGFRVSPPLRGAAALAVTRDVHGVSASIRPLVGSVKMPFVTVLLVSVLATLVVVGRIEAAPIITGLTPTGSGKTPGNIGLNTRDQNWTVVRVAASGTTVSGTTGYQPGYPKDVFGDPVIPPTGGGVNPTSGEPYASYVFQSGSMPAGYLGGAANFGYCGGLWIGLQNSSKSIVNGQHPDEIPPQPIGEYHSSAVFALTFQSNETGVASFDFWGASDNAVAFFVGGTVTTSTSVVTGLVENPSGPPIVFPNAANTGTNFPTIFGGTQIQSTSFMNGFGTLRHFVGNAPVDFGNNTLYAVVYDYGRDTGFMFSPVPEPSSVVMAAIAGGCILLGSRRRWPRQKAKPDLSDPSCTASS
jgi:hypothetical protein